MASTARLVVRSRRIVGPDDVIAGAVVIDGERIDRVVAEDPVDEDARVLDVGDAWVAPGFVDLHTHGLLGVGPEGLDGDGLARLAEGHAAHGTTAFVVSTMTTPEASIIRSLEGAKAARGDARVGARFLGIHLEGPFLNPACCGAQLASACRPADLAEAERWWRAGQGAIRSVTLAPELDEGLAVTRFFRERGVIVALGHSAADFDTARAAVDAGATVVTHLFNGMRPFHHRAPGLVGLALTDDRVTCELISDGNHLDAATVRLAWKAKGPAGCTLVSDSIPATGEPDGAHTLGGQAIVIEDGVARLPDGTLAGSTTMLDRAVPIAGAALDDTPAALRAASTTPARVVGWKNHALEPGAVADLVVLAHDGIQATIVGGELITPGAA